MKKMLYTSPLKIILFSQYLNYLRINNINLNIFENKKFKNLLNFIKKFLHLIIFKNKELYINYYNLLL